MLGIPLFGDQPDNLVRMKAEGVTTVVDFTTMTTGGLKDAINTVNNDNS